MFSSWSMFACNLANQAKNCNTNWHRFKTKHFAHQATVSCCSLLAKKKVTCCAVSILSFSISSIWKPLSRTSSVEAGTVAVKGDCRDRDERLHKSSMGNCKAKQGSLFLNIRTKPLVYEASWTARRAASASPLISIQANIPCCITFIKMFTLQRSELNSHRGNYIVLLTSLTFGK